MRGKPVKKRQLESDLVYKSKVVTRMVNTVMKSGKKSTAERIVYAVLGKLASDPKEATVLFEEAVRNVMPKQEVRSRRVGGATYQIPYPLKHERAEALAVRWIVKAAKKKAGKDMSTGLLEELKNAKDGVGDAIKKRDDTHKMAEANRAFSHFRL